MEHQITVLTQILENFDDGFLIKYIVMAGYGKTTSAVAIGKLVQLLNKMPKYARTQVRLVFTCNVDSVRLEVAKLLFHTGITFGSVAHKYWERKMVRTEQDWYIKKHPSCKEDHPTVLITGPEFPSMLFVLSKQKEKLSLFFDNLTVGADTRNSFALKANSKVLANLPKRTILSTATFPDDADIGCVYDIYKRNYPLGKNNLPPISCTDIKISLYLFLHTIKHNFQFFLEQPDQTKPIKWQKISSKSIPEKNVQP